MTKDRLLGAFGVGSYILTVLSSATNLDGQSVVPMVVVGISGIATAVFIFMAVIRLWQKSRSASILLAFSATALLILTVTHEVLLPSYGSPIIISLNASRVVYFIAFVWAIVKLVSCNSQKGELSL